MDKTTDSTLPTIPTYPEFTAMIEAGDNVELHYMRQREIYYKALAEGYAADVVRKNAEIERLRDFIAGVKTDGESGDNNSDVQENVSPTPV